MALVANPLAPITALEVCYISPLQQQGRSPGQRSRSRRSDRSSSDSSSGTAWDGFGEEEFRAGGPHLSEPPCETLRGIPPNHQYHDRLTGPQHLQLEQELLDLARETNPEIDEIRFCGRRSLFEPKETPAVTVLFHGKRTGRGWIDVARKIRQRLHQKGLTQVRVEILDPRFDQRLKPYPCSPRDAIFPVWEDVVERILRSTDLSGVLTIGCYRIGSDDRNKSSPTILVGVDRKSTRDWKVLREALVHVLDNFALPDVAILLRKDTSVLRQATANTPAAANCTKEVNLGYSLCPRKQQYGRGTFGGWVELRNPKTGAWVPFGLTCTHCIIPEEKYLSQAEKPVFDNWKWNGVPFADGKAAEVLLMDSPSRSELQRGLRSLVERIDKYTQNPTFQKVEKAKMDDDFVMPYEENIWKNTSALIKSLQDEQAKLDDFLNKGHFAFGCVMAASGLKNKSAKNPAGLGSIIDWALIKPVHRSIGSNHVPSDKRPGFSSLVAFSPRGLQADEELAKIGYVTGFTHGLYSGLRSASISTKMVNGEEVHVRTMEHAILSASNDNPIVQKGDSGSLIFDIGGGVVGMCFGGAHTGDILYFTHIADLIQSIKEVSGVSEIRLQV